MSAFLIGLLLVLALPGSVEQLVLAYQQIKTILDSSKYSER